MSLAEFAHAVWEGEHIASRAARAVLTPPSWVFARAVAARNARFDAEARTARTRRAPLAALSVGNLTVGGTGKTPVAAWCVEQLRARGAAPAIVLRGVGDDEWRVHGLLNPHCPVVVASDRHEGMIVARTKGADCAVLDDAFQHRQAQRAVDLVLVSADRWTGRVALLPAGPFREPLSALRRADVAIITVKAATSARIGETMEAIRRASPETPVAVVRLSPSSVRMVAAIGASRSSRGEEPRPAAGVTRHPASWLRGQRLSVVSGIGDPEDFEAQIEAAGALLGPVRRFPDHHRYTPADVNRLVRDAEGSSGVICTLKDAVKLGPLWPREAPVLWYLSQSVVVERGAELLDRALARLLAARAGTTPTAG
ncbi:MAG: tetraacyldisaccharide 4'-kinase [Gemmatimonadaceae bacterium]|nr:tetraacyldisaccharide 4'-kinase [Gemmatimonadaceae bacterium]